jgi:hypothetical protein
MQDAREPTAASERKTSVRWVHVVLPRIERATCVRRSETVLPSTDAALAIAERQSTPGSTPAAVVTELSTRDRASARAKTERGVLPISR